MIFVFGFRSPYAWLADRLIEDCLPAGAAERISRLPLWEPDAAGLAALNDAGSPSLYRPMSRERQFYILQDIRRLSRHLGYAIKWPVDPPDIRWELPHRAWLAAERLGRGQEARRAIFAARWERGEPICDPATLASILRPMGLPGPAELDTAPGGSRDEAFAALRLANGKGVFGLPTFIVGKQRFWGVDRLAFALSEAGLPHRSVAERWVGEAGDDQARLCDPAWAAAAAAGGPA
ncbi:MAG TPA: DsbA family protein [Rhodopila sp.]|jgi:2-hydroxychromene-2-carboxylate isomerase|nr:DsbA family protein [Rhodopila sp.]